MKGWKPQPLPSSFMFTSIIGFFISAYFIFPESYNWGITFLLFFTIMFIASLIGMTKSPVTTNKTNKKSKKR